MAINTAFVVVIGFLVGIFINLIPIVGGSVFNFIIGVVIVSYQQLAQEVLTLPLIPLPIYIFTLAYFVGVFVIKLLALLPIPVIQPIALMLRTEP